MCIHKAKDVQIKKRKGYKDTGRRVLEEQWLLKAQFIWKKAYHRQKTNVFNIRRALTNILKTRKMCKEHEKADNIKGQ